MPLSQSLEFGGQRVRGELDGRNRQIEFLVQGITFDSKARISLRVIDI